MSTGISFGAATDAIYTLAETSVVGVTVNGQPAQAADGWPNPDQVAFGLFVVGLQAPPPEVSGETAGTRSWAGLGAKRFREDFTVPCFIDVRVAGTVQKTARDIAETIYKNFWQLLVADLTLAAALPGGGWSEIRDLTSTPSNVGTVAEPGRRQLITFGVHCNTLNS